MPLPRMRPSFRLSAECGLEQAIAALRRGLSDHAQTVEGSFSRRHAVLCMPAADRRFWSPCLDLSFEASGGEPTESSAPASDSERVEIWATYSPRPEIWTAFVFATGTLLIAACLGASFGVAQLLSGHTPSAFVIPAVAFALAVALYFSALFGQSLSLKDMYVLRAYVEVCLASAEKVAHNAVPHEDIGHTGCGAAGS